MKKSNIIYLLILLIIVFAGCAKDGETGPKGNTGDTGATGATGAPGNQGNTNVEVKKFTVTLTGDINTGFLWTTIQYEHYENNIPELTQAVVDSGAVMLYILSNKGWVALPWTQITNTSIIIKTYSFAYSLNNIWLSIGNSNGTQWMTSSSSFDYKLIIIPHAQRIANPNVNLNNYEEVRAAYNLKD